MDICQETGISRFIFVGYILNNAFSQDEEGWEEIFALVVDYLCIKEQLFNLNELLEG